MAYKIFRQGEPPSQRDLQMLMDQGVIVATSTQRPFAPHEGMLIYEVDTHGYMWYNGTTWVALGSAIDAWVSGNNLSVPGDLSAGGTLGVTGAATFNSDVTIGGDNITVGGFGVNRLVDGKTVASASNTGNVTTTATAVPSANAQSVSVIQDRAYRASGFCSVLGSVAGDRFAFEIWNGTVGSGTKLGGSVNCRITQTGTYQSYPFGFLWRAPSTTVIANINLSIVRISGTGNIQAQSDENYFMIIEHLGAASAIGGL